MKTLICHCEQCKAVRKRLRKRNHTQTKQVRAARQRVKTILKEAIKNGDSDVDDLPESVTVDYYA